MALLPPTVGTASRQEHRSLRLEIVDGELPAELSGSLFVVSPCGNPGSRGLPRIRGGRASGEPLFNGDAMLHRVEFEAGQARLTCRVVRTIGLRFDDHVEHTLRHARLRFRNRGLERRSERLGRRELPPSQISASPDGSGLILNSELGAPLRVCAHSLECHQSLDPEGWLLPEGESKLLLDPPRLAAHAWSQAETDGKRGRWWTANWSKPSPGPSALTRLRREGPGFLKLCRAELCGAETPARWEYFRVCDAQGQPLVPVGEILAVVASRDGVAIVEGRRSVPRELDLPVAAALGGTIGRRLLREAQSHLRKRSPAMTRILWIDAAQLLRGQDPAREPREVDVRARVHELGVCTPFFAGATIEPDAIALRLIHAEGADAGDWIGSDSLRGRSQVPASALGFPQLASPRACSSRSVRLDRHGQLRGASPSPLCPAGSGVFEAMEYEGSWLCTSLGSLDSSRSLSDFPAPGLVRVDASQRPSAAYAFPAGHVAGGLQRLGATRHWLSAMVFGPRGSELWIFDARSLSEGPVARLRSEAWVFAWPRCSAYLEELPAPLPPLDEAGRRALPEALVRAAEADTELRTLVEELRVDPAGTTAGLPLLLD